MENTVSECELIGKIVTYSVTKETTSKGRVVDKVDKKDHVDDQFTVTGYMIQDEDSGKIACVSYWRIQQVHKERTGHLPGGYRRDNQ